MSTKQPMGKSGPPHPHSQHGGKLSKTNAPSQPLPRGKETNAQQPRPADGVRATRSRTQDTHTSENMQEHNTSKNTKNIPNEKLQYGGGRGGDGGGSSGGGEKTKKTGTKVSAIESQSNEKNGAESDEKRREGEEKVDSKESDDKNDDKHAESKMEPKNIKLNEPKQKAKGKPEKHTEDKTKPNKKESNEDSKTKREGNDTKQVDSKTKREGNDTKQVDSKTKREGNDTKQVDSKTKREGNDTKQVDSKTKREGNDTKQVDSKTKREGTDTKQVDSKTSNRGKDAKQVDTKPHDKGKEAKQADSKGKNEEKKDKQTDSKGKGEGKDAKQAEVKASPKGKDAKQAEVKASPKGKDAKQAEVKASPKGKDAKQAEVKASPKGKDGKQAEPEARKKGKDAQQIPSKSKGGPHERTELNDTQETNDSHTHTENKEAHHTTADSAEKDEGNDDESASGSKAQPEEKEKKKKSLDEDSLQMFLSTDQLPERAANGTWMGPDQCSDETKRRQEEIIRRILEEFDLDETMRKYRNSNAQSYRPKGTGLQDFQFRSELLRLMGTEEIRLNDTEWSQKFKDKLTEDYSRLLDEQEQALAKAEKKRLHRLIMDGIVPKPEEHQAASNSVSFRFSQFNLYGDTVSGTAPSGISFATGSNSSIRKKLHESGSHHVRRRVVGQCTSADWDFKPTFSNDQSNRRERSLNAHRQEKIYHPSQEVQTMVEMEKEAKEGKTHKKGGGQAVTKQDSLEEKDSLDHQIVRDEMQEMRESIAKYRKQRLERMPPNIRRLYEEESVPGLYKIAQELICLDSDNKPAKKGVRMDEEN